MKKRNAMLATVLVLLLLAWGAAWAGDIWGKELVVVTAVDQAGTSHTQTWKNVNCEIQQVTLYMAGGATGTCSVVLKGLLPAVGDITLYSASAMTNADLLHYWPLANVPVSGDAGLTNHVPYLAYQQDVQVVLSEFDTNRVNTLAVWLKGRALAQ